MNFAQENNGSSRVTGFGIVVLIHVLLIWAIASGLAKTIVEKVAGPIETKVVEEVKPPPPPPEKVVPPPPDIKAPPPPFVPVPEVVVTAPAPPAPPMQSTNVPPPAGPIVAASPTPAPPAPVARKGPVTAGMVCTKMSKPEMPSLNWSGDTLFKAVATVKAGRVTSVEITSLKGGVDRKAQRALISAIQTTLQETYECPGDHVFEQEFQFHND